MLLVTTAFARLRASRRPRPRANPWFDLLVALCIVGAALLAFAAANPHLQALRSVLRAYPRRGESGWLVVATAGAGLALAGAIACLPARWRATALVASVGAASLVPVATSQNLLPLMLALALLVLGSWPGRVVAAALLRRPDCLEGWVIGTAFGVGLLALLGRQLGYAGWLRATTVWPLVLALALATLAVPASRRLLRGDFAAAGAWLRRPIAPGGAWWPALGLVIGAFWVGLVGALAPEIGSDAIRQRLALAAVIAREGRIAPLETYTLSSQPGLGEVVYAVVLACAPLAAAKLFNLLVGLWCGAGVWALGRRLGGQRAALAGTLLFATSPFLVALYQTAYSDLFATLFTLAFGLVLAMCVPLRPGAAAVALLALFGGLAVKASFLVIAIGLCVALAAILCRDWARRLLPSRRVAATVIAPALVAIVLVGLLTWWLGRGLPLAASLSARLALPRLLLRAQLDNPEQYGVGRSLADLPGLPFALLSRTELFGEMRGGFAGYAWPLALPLLFLSRPDRRRWPLLLGVACAALAWMAITQYLRYAAPLAALLAALCGVAYALVLRRCGRAVALAAQAVMLVLCGLWILGFLNTTLFYPGDLPYGVVFGRQSREAYLGEHVTAYAPLRLLDQEARVGKVISAYEYPQLYSRAPLYSATYTYGETNEVALQQILDGGGYTQVVIDRGFLPPGWDHYGILDEDFLRRNAILVGGGRNAYLYRLVPPAQRGHDQRWAQGRELLPNGGLEDADGSRPRGWSPTGQPRYDQSGTLARTGQSAFRSTPQDWYTTTVPVSPLTTYLLSHATRAEGSYGSARLQVNWLNADGWAIGVSIEVVPTSPQRYFQHSMLATAPPGAAKATIYLVAQEGVAWFDDASFRALAPGAQRVPPVADGGAQLAPYRVRLAAQPWRREDPVDCG